MQDYIPREIDINGRIENIVVKQYDNNSRYLHVTISDADLTDGTFELTGCSTALYIKPEGSDDDSGVSFVSGEIADADEGIVTFLLPGGVTQIVGRYECEIWIYQGSDSDRPVISTKPFTLIVEKSIKNDSAIQATQSMSALDAKMVDIQAVKNQMAALVASPAGSGGDVGTEITNARIGFNGVEYENLGNAIRTQIENAFNGSALYIDATRFSELFSGNFNNVPNNRMYPIYINFGTATAANTSNAPDTEIRGTLLTFGRKGTTRYNLDVQMFVTQSREKIYIRVYDGENPSTNTPGSWSAWTVIGGTHFEESINEIAAGLEAELAELPQYRAGINNLYVSYNYKISNVKDDGTFHVSQQDTSAGVIVQRWTDLPDTKHNFIVTNAGYSTGWILQTATATNTYTDIYRRIIPRAGVTGDPSNWVKIGHLDPRLKVLAIGDSICADTRNNKRGYVKPLGVQSRNAGESGASLAIIESRAGYWVIPERFIKFFNDHSKNVNESNDGWEPDVILANGGRNDYNFDAPLGEIPTEPSLNSDGTPDYSSLDLSTAMGGLQKLFLLMIEKYPKAQRFFVTTHKIFRTASTETDKNGYAPTRANGAGYTAAQLNDAIIACCNVYGVKVIDIFNESMLDSAFAPYRYNANATNNYFDADGVHPLERGYLEGYVPLIREAIRTGTVKGD